MAGVYSATDLYYETFAGNVTVSVTGAVTGSTPEGCTLSGSLFVPNERYNQFYIDIGVNGCVYATRIIGAGAYDFDDGSMVIVGADNTTGYAWILE